MSKHNEQMYRCITYNSLTDNIVIDVTKLILSIDDNFSIV